MRALAAALAVLALLPSSALAHATLQATVQTYTGGEVVRWIGPEDSDNPAPIVTVTSGDEPAATATPAPTTDDDGNGLAIAALIVGALGLLAGLAAARRANARSGAAA